MQKVYAIVSVARQADGEYVVVKPERAYFSKDNAEKFVNSLARQYAEVIQTPTGPVECVCTRGVFELDVEP